MIPGEVLAAIVAAIEATEGRPVRLVEIQGPGGEAGGWPAPWAWAGRQGQMAARTALLARPQGRRSGAGPADAAGGTSMQREAKDR